MMLLISGSLAACMQAPDAPITQEVSMVGIDYHNKEYKVTLQLAGSGTDHHQQNPRHYQGAGSTVEGALKAAELRCGSTLVWSRLKVVVIGKQAAVHGADSSALTLAAKLELKPSTLVAVAEPTAELLVKGEKTIKGIDASKIELRLKEGIRKQILPESRMAAITKAAEDQNSGSLVSYLIVHRSKEPGMSLELAGSGVFYQNTLFALLDPPLTEAVLRIRDQPRQIGLQALGNRFDLLSGMIKKSKMKLVPVINDGKLSFIVCLGYDGGNISLSEGDTVEEDEEMKEEVSISMQSSVGGKLIDTLKLTASKN